MDKKQWIGFCNGSKVSQIKKKKERFGESETPYHVYDCINALKPDEYTVIRRHVTLYPGYFDEIMRIYGNKEASTRFKKHGNLFNLKNGTQGDRMENKLSLQKLIMDAVKKEYKHQTIDDEPHQYGEHAYWNIIRKGFSWRNTRNIKSLITQTDLIKGWVLASGIIKQDLPIKFSNPGGIFIVDLPSTSEALGDKFYNVIMRNFTGYTKGVWRYANWVNLFGSISGYEGSVDHFSNQNTREEIPNMYFNFQLIAASILRQHFTDKRKKQGKFSSRKRNSDQPIDDVSLNIALPPTKRKIHFDWKLGNCVLIEHKNSKGDIVLKPLNKSEKEILHSLDLYRQGFGKCYGVDDMLKSLDHMVEIIWEERAA